MKNVPKKIKKLGKILSTKFKKQIIQITDPRESLSNINDENKNTYSV